MLRPHHDIQPGNPRFATKHELEERPIVYAIFAHHLPEQVVRMVHRLQGPFAKFVIHVDRRADEHVLSTIRENLSEHLDVHYIKQRSTGWGGFGLVAAQLDAVRFALEQFPDFSHVLLLSGQDYPLVSNEKIWEHFRHDQCPLSYMSATALPNPNWPRNGGFDRVRYHHVRIGARKVAFFRPGEFAHPFVRPIWSMISRSKWFGSRSLPGFGDIYGGSAVMTLNHECAEYMDRFRRSNRWAVSHFRTVKNPDELFFQTVLMNAKWLRGGISNESLHYVDWTGGGSHPKILTSADIPEMRVSGKLFARKFDVRTDPSVLDLLDELVDPDS